MDPVTTKPVVPPSNPLYEPIPDVVPPVSDKAIRVNLYFKFIALILSIAVSPVCAHYITGKVEKLRIQFEKEDRANKRESELQMHNQKMRNVLVKEIMDICKTADLDNVAHAYRLGWIAEVVEANPSVFHLNMKSAKKKLDTIIEKIALMDNVRKRLMEARRSEENLQSKVTKYDKANVDLEKQLVRARKGLENAQWRGYTAKKKWQDKISGLEKDLSRSKFRRRMYLSWLSHERTRRRMYAYQLSHTKKVLQRKMKDAAKQKTEDSIKISQLNDAIVKLLKKSRVANNERDKVKALAQKLTDSNTKAQSTITDLKEEVEKLKAANSALVTERKTLSKKLSECPPQTTMAPVK